MLHNPMPIKYILKDNTAETETRLSVVWGFWGTEKGLTANKEEENLQGGEVFSIELH